MCRGGVQGLAAQRYSRSRPDLQGADVGLRKGGFRREYIGERLRQTVLIDLISSRTKMKVFKDHLSQ